MIESRRNANPQRPCGSRYCPSSSGPRCTSCAAIVASAAGATRLSGVRLRMPAMPHTPGLSTAQAREPRAVNQALVSRWMPGMVTSRNLAVRSAGCQGMRSPSSVAPTSSIGSAWICPTPCCQARTRCSACSAPRPMMRVAVASSATRSGLASTVHDPSRSRTFIDEPCQQARLPAQAQDFPSGETRHR